MISTSWDAHYLAHVIINVTFDTLDCRDQTGSSRPGYPSGPSPPGSSRRRRENEANLRRSVWRPEARRDKRGRRGTKVVILLWTGARSPVQPMQPPLAKLHSRVYWWYRATLALGQKYFYYYYPIIYTVHNSYIHYIVKQYSIQKQLSSYMQS